jgi:hypothetical protein
MENGCFIQEMLQKGNEAREKVKSREWVLVQ